MYRNQYSRVILIVILVTVILTGCAKNTEVEKPMTGLANPASVYCQGLGYKEETRENELGQYGVCILPKGLECDTWDFLAGRCGVEHSYCAQQGFELKGSNDKNVGTCVFDDGSKCDEFAYYQGECLPGEPYP